MLPSVSVAANPDCAPLPGQPAELQAKMEELIKKYGGDDFINPISVSPTSEQPGTTSSFTMRIIAF